MPCPEWETRRGEVSWRSSKWTVKAPCQKQPDSPCKAEFHLLESRSMLPPGDAPASDHEDLDLLIIGGGIGGVICLKYALDAGLRALVLEREAGVGGIWRSLPAWQEIQSSKEEWTLGDIPIAGADQASIL